MKTVSGIIILFIIVLGIGFIWTRQSTEESVDTQVNVPSIQPTNMNQTTQKTYTTQPEMNIDEKKSYSALIKTNKGDMTIELFPKEAPVAVNNFVFLSKEGFYTNTPFHRVISGFMIQGGDPTGTGTGGPGYRFADEKVTREYVRGTLAMANAGPNTNGSQFFIMHKDSNSLPKDYVIFGSIRVDDQASFTTLDALLETPVTMSMSGERSKPSEDLQILSITISET